MRVTSRLWWDEVLALGLVNDRDTYPPISREEARVCDAFAAGLFVSKSLAQWSYHGLKQGRRDAFKRLLEILSAGKLRPIVRA